MSDAVTSEMEQGQSKWRLHLGLIVLVVGFLSPLLIPLVAMSSLSTEVKTVISGALAVGVPELLSVAAIAIMGKPGFDQIKIKFFAFFKRSAPADHVSRPRYRVGLIMFASPLLFGWLEPYLSRVIPGCDFQGLIINISLDVMFIVSFFVLGGDFWDKVHGLFVYGSTGNPPPSSTC
jgi:hypothetical protein